MKITESRIDMQSSHARLDQREMHESLTVRWSGQQRPGDRPSLALQDEDIPSAQVRLSRESQEALLRDAQSGAALRSHAEKAERAESVSDEASDPLASDPTLIVVRSMIEFLTGEKIKIFDASRLQTEETVEISPPPAQTQGPVIEYRARESVSEQESTQFAAEGFIQTADGRQISFSLSFEMERSYRRDTEINVTVGQSEPPRQKKDPLVINFGGTAAQLTEQRFSFDIDSDGNNDQVAMVTGGSGFLALDRNSNGKIDNGSELFGSRTGDGFAELAALDTDRNGWIDENDAGYTRLTVWLPTQDKQLSLQQAGVGAIHLGRVDSPFDIKDSSNQLLGSVRTSGVYLKEDGSAGSIQQVDLAV